ncbi:thiolase C-terminal domain-containing protein [Nocardioides sp. Bht2]|uniref:thiolase C-terminal domain-containing protein n=1 Tax=Nocardioides sp. Bht2 TaxID=3392297 RepID=UPI0039B3E9C5
MSLGSTCAIVGVGDTAFVRGTERSTFELHLEASLAAIADAGISPSDIDGIVPNSLAGRPVEEFVKNLGLGEVRYSVTIPMGGASFLASLQNACMALATGQANYVLLPCGRRGYSGERISTGQAVWSPAMETMRDFEVPMGNVGAVQWFAQAAQRHMHQYGTTSAQLGHVAVNSRNNANLNPHALMYSKTLTLEQHQASRIIASPFRLFDCSLESDGAGAIIVTTVERARDLRREVVEVVGIASSHTARPTSLTEKQDMTVVEGLRDAGARALRMADLTIDDADCLIIHEGFSWYVIAALEALGVVGLGEGGPYVEEGHIRLDGRTPVNPHGGALGEGHASGVNHVIEAVRQLRGSVEIVRQIADCRNVVVANEGGFFDGAVAVLGRGL